MKHTESHFGLTVNHANSDLISADNGDTWMECPLSDEQFTELVDSVECWLERELDEQEQSDLKEICGR